MEAEGKAGKDWRRVCDLASRLLDSPTTEWDRILTSECAGDQELRQRVMEVCGSYSESDEILGVPAVSPLVFEDSLIGKRVGPWEILRVLGEGGMGRVYLVVRADGVFHQYAALKLNRRNHDTKLSRQFHLERSILAMLEHPSIARAIDGGATEAGVQYLVMEYVADGCPIDAFHPNAPAKSKIRLFLNVLSAVEVAHRQKIVHRDLKPANILVTPGGLPKVLDFGIAKLFGNETLPAANQTNTGAALTPTYASPEQLLQQTVSHLSDIYSLGAVLYKMLAGRPPHQLDGLNLLQSVQKVTKTDPAPPSAFCRELDASVDAIVTKALERNPALRYGTVTEFAEDLRRYLDDVPVQARPWALRHRISRIIRRHRGGTVAVGICLMLVAGVGAGRVGRWREERRQREELLATGAAVTGEYQSQLSRMRLSTALRNQIASDERKYLDTHYSAALADPELHRLWATAYGLVASHQTDRLAAQDSLVKSLSLWQEIAKDNASETDRMALAEAARRVGWSQINMGKLTEAGESLALALRSLDSLEKSGGKEPARLERVFVYFELSRLGAWGGKGEQAISYAQKAVAEHEKLPPRPLERQGIAVTRMQLADTADTYGAGDPKLFAEGLRQTRLAVQAVRAAPACEDLACREVKAAILTRAPVIFHHHNLVAEALSVRDGVDLAEELLAEDTGNPSALASLRIGLMHLGWSLRRVGRLEECLRVRKRMLEVSAVSGRSPGPSEDRLKEAIACGEVGRVLVDLNRLGEAQGYFERQAEILAHPPTENVYWFMRQTDVYQDLGMLNERLGRLDAARADFAKASTAAETFLAKTGSARAMAIVAEAHYLQGNALVAVDPANGCRLLRSSLERYEELWKTSGQMASKNWKTNTEDAKRALRKCKS